MTSLAVSIPLLNPNEPEAMLAVLHVKDGQQVQQGDILCTLETTKAAADLPAEQAGYVVGLRYSQGQSLPAGEILCYLADSPDWQPPANGNEHQDTAQTQEPPEGVRMTRPALKLARSLGLDLSGLPQGPLITESYLKETLGAGRRTGKQMEQFAVPESAFDPTAIIVYGGGGHGKSLIDLVRTLGTYRIAAIIDDGLKPGQEVMGIPVLGGREALPDLFQRGVRLAVNAVGGIGNVSVRIKVFHSLLETGFTCPALAHPSAVIERSASMEPGVQVFAQAYVGSEARIGFGTIINTGAIVSHDCDLGNYVNLSPGAILAGEVHVGEGALIGMGVTVNLGVQIGAGARIGNGATVKSDVAEGAVVRAGTIHG